VLGNHILACVPVLPGNADGDAAVDVFDIDPFAFVFTDAAIPLPAPRPRTSVCSCVGKFLRGILGTLPRVCGPIQSLGLSVWAAGFSECNFSDAAASAIMSVL